MNTKKKGILERLKDGPVLGDGGYLLELKNGDGCARARSRRKLRCCIPMHCANFILNSARLERRCCRR